MDGIPEDARSDLQRLVRLLTEWQRTHNLVAPSSLNDVWTRHVSDSLQLLHPAPPFGAWLDLGSGAGFPGLVIAIASKGDEKRQFTLVESNAKKAAFLRAVIRETSAPATVLATRIEELTSRDWSVISARALAPLPRLLQLAAPLMGDATVLLLLKGREFAGEVEAARHLWHFDVVTRPSVTDSEGVVAEIRNVKPKVSR